MFFSYPKTRNLGDEPLVFHGLNGELGLPSNARSVPAEMKVQKEGAKGGESSSDAF